MSTKVYNAYKLKKSSDLWPLVHDINLKATENVVAKIKEMYINLYDAVDIHSSKYNEAFERNKMYFGDVDRSDYLARLSVIHDSILEKIKIHFCASVGFRHYKNKIYLIHYTCGFVQNVFDFLDNDDRIEEYHYQNQTDKPDEISQREWNKRRKIWYGMDDADQWKDVLILEICNPETFYMIDPYFDLVREDFRNGTK